MSTDLAFSIVTTNQSWLDEDVEALDATRFEALYVVDHPSFPIPDPWTWLAWVAGRTERIRLGTHVTGAPFHHPAQLARQIATVDRISGGRAVLGIGTAYEHLDFAPYGHTERPFRERLELLEETLRVLRGLWTQEKTEFEGRHFRLEGGASFEPKPIQQPHPPIVVGLNREGAALGVAAELADGINTWQLGPRQIAALRPHVERACEVAGRDPHALRITSDVLFARGADRQGAEGLAHMVRDMARSWGRSESVTDWDAGGILYGDADTMAEQARAFAEAGVRELSVSFSQLEEVQWFDEHVIGRLTG